MPENLLSSLIKSNREYWAEREAAALQAIASRDLIGAVRAMDLGRQHCFVWPEVYERTYYYQRIYDVPGFPVVMRSARTSLYKKYTKNRYAIRVIERYLRMFRPTVVDQSAFDFIRGLWARLNKKHELYYFHQQTDFTSGLREAVLVNGERVALSRDRIQLLEKSLRIMDRLRNHEGFAA